MTVSLKKISENTLFTLNVFIIFIVLFDNIILVPAWLRSVGRFHPLILHFPIVILILTMVTAFFRTASLKSYGLPENLTANLLLTGALAAAITVITGLFLSKEDGYEGATLQSHKWMGIGVVFAASLIYAYRRYLWQRSAIAKTCSLLTIFLIVAAGHYGSTVTHGDNFLLLKSTENSTPVSFDQAIVFDHIIKPVIKSKCLSCHNADKSKGGLDLTDSTSFIKGGKTGKLFVASQPEQSLLLKRIHLPDTDEKRMPPEGKPSLTQEEMSLLQLWIASGAGFSSKVNALPVRDSLRQIAATLLDNQQQFDFAAANEQTVNQLNNEYRLVTTLAKGSPALSVKLYNRLTYSGKTLQELEPVKMQVVSLDLNKLPVTDADMKIIAQFQNLRRLNLNFTDITGAGLKELIALKELKKLSLSGTKISSNDLGMVNKMKSLAQVTIWNTVMDTMGLGQLRTKNKTVAFITGFNDDGVPAKLTPPQLSNNTVVFSSTLPLKLRHPIYGVSIRYTTDGTEPDSVKSPVLTDKVLIDQNTTLRAKAFKPGWNSSDISEFTFYKNAFRPDSIYFLKEPFENYRANGMYTFFDGEMGDFDIYRYNKNKWIGFKGRDMELLMEYTAAQRISSVTLHTLISVDDKVFPPTSVEIWGGKDKNNLDLISAVKTKMPLRGAGKALTSITCKFPAQNISYLKIVARPLMKLPGWSDEKGKASLMLVDELLIN